MNNRILWLAPLAICAAASLTTPAATGSAVNVPAARSVEMPVGQNENNAASGDCGIKPAAGETTAYG